MPPSEARPLRLLISFAPEDRELKDQLVQHLQVLVRFAGIELWEADRVRAGANWQQEAEAALERTDVALVLISSAFLASDLLQDVEVPKLFQRREHGGLKVIPVLIRSCLWEAHPWLSTLKTLPTSGAPIASFEGDQRDRALVDVAAEIGRITGASTRPIPGALATSGLFDKKDLYTRIHILFETAIKQAVHREKFTLAEAFFAANAQVRILAPEHIQAQYALVGGLLKKWSMLYARSLPEQYEEGGKVYTIIQSPDPSEKFKKPAENAYVELQSELNTLFKLMRIELTS